VDGFRPDSFGSEKGTWQVPSRSLDGLHNRSGHFAEDKSLLPLLGVELDHWLLSYQWFVFSVVFLTLEKSYNRIDI